MHHLPSQSKPSAPGMQPARHPGRWLLLALCMLLAWPGSGQADEAPQTEYRLKVAFLYNFARFVTWPGMPAGPFTLCLLGSDPLGDAIDTLQNKPVKERQIRILHLDSPARAGQCQLLFIGRSDTRRLHEVIARLGGQPVLTVSDIDGFVASGGMIGFRLIDNKVSFEINTGVAGAAGLSISSKLLALATTTRPGN
jgi:hypothetical protein